MTLTVALSASAAVPTGTAITVEASQWTNPNGVPITIDSSGIKNTTINGGQTKNVTFQLNIGNVAGTVEYKGRITSATSSVTIDIHPPGGVGVTGSLTVN